MSRVVKALLNIGLDDQKTYGIPLLEVNERANVEDEQAHIMVNVLKLARDYNQEEEDAEAARIAAFDEEAIERDIQSRVTRAEMEEKVKAKMAAKSSGKGDKSPRGPQPGPGPVMPHTK